MILMFLLSQCGERTGREWVTCGGVEMAPWGEGGSDYVNTFINEILSALMGSCELIYLSDSLLSL